MFYCHIPRVSVSTTSMRHTATPNSSTTTITSTATTINTTTHPTILDSGGSSTRITINTVNTIKTILCKRIMAGKRFNPYHCQNGKVGSKEVFARKTISVLLNHIFLYHPLS